MAERSFGVLSVPAERACPRGEAYCAVRNAATAVLLGASMSRDSSDRGTALTGTFLRGSGRQHRADRIPHRMSREKAHRAFPSIPSAPLLAAAVGPGFGMVVLVLALILWPRFAPLVRARAMAACWRDFVTASRILRGV
ncbi:hypothetical protein [Falsiroseomonas oryzae]|uniref:hypothetical protein n=1 Tax=Falsiroseomonas oryzae TaxID=2766473 RepID=UPI0022EA18DA|nr:hypothetical protein [Roseomonas sp. MO-31]